MRCRDAYVHPSAICSPGHALIVRVAAIVLGLIVFAVSAAVWAPANLADDLADRAIQYNPNGDSNEAKFGFDGMRRLSDAIRPADVAKDQPIKTAAATLGLATLSLAWLWPTLLCWCLRPRERWNRLRSSARSPVSRGPPLLLPSSPG